MTVSGGDVSVISSTMGESVRATMSESQGVRVDLFDLLGRRVATLHDGEAAASQTLDIQLPSSLTSGAYLARVTGERFSQTVRVRVVR